VPIARPIWLPGPHRPIFAWFHCPDDHQARAGVVVCPPVGFDYFSSHYALRVLAEQLTDAGFCVVRFDYDGTGDSLGGHGDPDRVGSWLGSVASARVGLRRAGLDRICLVGLRLGATLAAVDAAGDGGTDQLVLWDPTASGRSFLVEQRAVSVMKLGVPATSEDGSVEIPGAVFDAAAVRSLHDLAIRGVAHPLARRVLALTRRDRPVDGALVRPTMGREEVVHEEAVGQAALLDRVAPYQELPLAAIRRIVDWLSEGAPTVAQRVAIPSGPSRAVVGRRVTGQAIVETAVRVPPAGLFGILTEAEPGGEPEAESGRLPAVIFLSVATEPHIGPARLWVTLARRWASAGFRTLRMDLSGLGDSPHRGGGELWTCYKPEAFDDVVDAARWMSPENPSNVVLVGLCSSGYQVLENALAIHARGAVAVNPRVSFLPAEHRVGRNLDERRRIALPKDAVPRTLREGGRLGGLRERFPDLAWRVRILASPQHRSGRWLTELVGQGTDTLIIATDHEVRPIRQGITGFQLRRLERTGFLRLEHVRGLQHGLLIASQRDMIADLVSDHVLDRFSRHPAPVADDPAPDKALSAVTR
jgi:alpha-beta hydrolase superfamily lysophospholipase